jgi:hypothetical protein
MRLSPIAGDTLTNMMPNLELQFRENTYFESVMAMLGVLLHQPSGTSIAQKKPGDC